MQHVALILLLSVTLASRPFGPFFGAGGLGFSPVTVRHNTGSGNDVVPQGATQLTAEAWAGGAGGSVTGSGRGGSSGSYGKKVFTVISSDWNKSIPWVVGNKGVHCLGTTCSGTDGVNSTMGGAVTLNGVTLNIVTNHGLASGVAPSAGTGGSTNTAGGAQSGGGIGGVAVAGDDSDAAGAGGDGSPHAAGDPPSESSDGENGMVKFKWE